MVRLSGVESQRESLGITFQVYGELFLSLRSLIFGGGGKVLCKGMGFRYDGRTELDILC